MHRFLKWRELLQLAPDVRAVSGIMRDYIVTLGPLVETLPPECRDALGEEPDIQAAAVTLLQAELQLPETDERRALLHEIAHTFASAAVRITLLHSFPLAAGSAARARRSGADAD